MSSPEKQKGDRAERAVVEWLHALGYTSAHRIRAGSPDDIGDIELGDLGKIVIEVKDRGKVDLPAWIRKLRIQKENKKAHLGIIIVKKRGSADPFDWAFVLDAHSFVNVLETRRWIEEN